MPSYRDLKNAQPGSLTKLAAAWSGVAESHTEASKMLVSQATDKLSAKSIDGLSIRAAHDRGDALNQQVKAGVREADAISDLIGSFGVDVFVLRDELLDLEAQVKAQEPHMTLDETSGTVSYTPPPRDSGYESHPEIYAEIIADGAEAARRFTERIGDILSRARTADDTFTKNLETIAELDAPFDASFNPDSGQDIADAEAREDADKVSDLLHGGADGKVSAAELSLANGLLARYQGDGVFATTLMDELGPKGLLSTSADIAHRFGTDGDLGNDELALTMRERLGLTLATATDTDNETHVSRNWMSDLRAEGASIYTVGDGENERVTPGYTLLAPLLTEGTFDDEFITPVAQHMLALDQQGIHWSSEPDPLAPYDKSSVNPVNGALIALDHSPVAATEVFSGAKPEHDFPAYPYAPPNVMDTVEPVADPLEYVLDTAGNYGSIDTDIAGNALEAAATGVSSESPPGDPRPIHTDDMTSVTRRLMDYVAAEPARFEGPDSRLGGMVDNMAGITVNYAEDFYQAYSETGAHELGGAGSHGEPLGMGGYKPPHSPSAATVQWLEVIGRDPTALASVSTASEAIMCESIGEVASAAHMQDVYDRPDLIDSGNAMNAVEPFARINAEMTNGYFEGLEDDTTFGGPENTREDAVNAARETSKYLVGKGLGLVPLVGDELGTASGYVIDHLFGGAEADAQAITNMDKVEFAADLQAKLKSTDAEWLDKVLARSELDPSVHDAWKEKILKQMGDEYYAYSQWPRDEDGTPLRKSDQ